MPQTFRATVGPKMAKSHFETKVEQEMQRLAVTSIKDIALGDRDRFTLNQGKYAGLETALKLFREAAKVDLDGDGDGL